MKTSHRLWDFLLSDREFESPDDTASPVFSSLFVTCLSAFMNLSCFATLKLCVSEKLTLHGLGFFFKPKWICRIEVGFHMWDSFAQHVLQEGKYLSLPWEMGEAVGDKCVSWDNIWSAYNTKRWWRWMGMKATGKVPIQWSSAEGRWRWTQHEVIEVGSACREDFSKAGCARECPDFTQLKK